MHPAQTDVPWLDCYRYRQSRLQIATHQTLQRQLESCVARQACKCSQSSRSISDLLSGISHRPQLAQPGGEAIFQRSMESVLTPP